MSKIGRNDPCPCGSGKKYKKCCLKKDQEAESERQTIESLRQMLDAGTRIVVGGTDEPACFVKDLYRVADWDALKRALAGREDVSWDGDEAASAALEDWNWVWLERGAAADGMDRVLANMHRRPEGLLVECMTAGRADRARALLESLPGAEAGPAAEFASRSIEDLAEAMVRRGKPMPRPQARPDRQLPEEAGDVVRQLLQRHYEQWVDMSLPALGGRTPRQAAALASEKAKVVELLKSVEDGEIRRAKAQGDRPLDFGFVWKELGLER